MWFVYIIECYGNTYYTGATNNVLKRYKEHCEGTGGKYTRSHKPKSILFVQSYASKSEALKEEYRIKQFSKKDKEFFIQQQYNNIL